jgi:hypothetical protein
MDSDIGAIIEFNTMAGWVYDFHPTDCPVADTFPGYG